MDVIYTLQTLKKTLSESALYGILNEKKERE